MGKNKDKFGDECEVSADGAFYKDAIHLQLIFALQAVGFSKRKLIYQFLVKSRKKENFSYGEKVQIISLKRILQKKDTDV